MEMMGGMVGELEDRSREMIQFKERGEKRLEKKNRILGVCGKIPKDLTLGHICFLDSQDRRKR